MASVTLTLEVPREEAPASVRVARAAAALRRGEPVLVADDADREGEADLVLSAELATVEQMNFLIWHGGGLICVAMDPAWTARLGLTPMVAHSTDPHETAFTVSVDAHGRFGVTTGISAHDRTVTARLLAYPGTRREDLRSPGHLFPLAARQGGVLVRRGHTEASTDLMRLAGLAPVAIIVEVLDRQGRAVWGRLLASRARRWAVPILSVEDVAQVRRGMER